LDHHPLRNKFHAALNISVANVLAAPMRGVGLTVQENGGRGGPDALREVYESLSIGFQANRALRIEHMMKRSLYGGSGWEGGSQGLG
jgi:hypothetical protein